MVSANLFLKVGKGTKSIARICLNTGGQKNKSDNMTHMHWKTIPTKLHLKKGDDGRSTGTLLEKEGQKGPIFVKRSTRIVNRTKGHVESSGEGNSSIHPAHQTRQKSSTIIQRFQGIQLHGSPSNWMEILTFNKFVFIRALG